MLHPPAWRKIFIGLLVVAVIGFAVWHFWPRNPDAKKDKKPPPVVVQVMPVKTADVPIYLDGLGTIQASNTVTVRSQVDGTLTKVAFTEGQAVKKGDLLAQIDPRSYQAQVNQAIATREKDAAILENAKRDLQRYINLGSDIAQQTVDTARSTIKQLEASVRADDALVANQKTLFSYTTITSPINGRTGIRQVDVGNLVHPGDTNGIVVVTQIEPVAVIFSLPQQNLPSINAQINAIGELPVLAMAADNQNIQDQGKLILVDNQIDQATGTIKLKAEFPNTEHMLWPGGFANVRLLLNTQADALVVPTVAVQRGPQGTYVYVLQPDHTVKLRPVTIGLAQDDVTIISDGLQAGEQVITDGMIKLQDGSKVTLPGEQPAIGDEHKSSRGHKPDQTPEQPGDKNTAADPSATPTKDTNPDSKTAHSYTGTNSDKPQQ